MKSFTDSRFANIFALLVGSNRDPQCDAWSVGDTVWTRERYGHWGQQASFQLETIVVDQPRAPAWRIMVVREHWWHGPERVAVRSGQWGKLVSGDRKAALKWFERQERGL
ncbi:MAG: hypothetical protein ACK4GK_03315 [Ferrovibrio sp.]